MGSRAGLSGREALEKRRVGRWLGPRLAKVARKTRRARAAFGCHPPKSAQGSVMTACEDGQPTKGPGACSLSPTCCFVTSSHNYSTAYYIRTARCAPLHTYCAMLKEPIANIPSAVARCVAAAVLSTRHSKSTLSPSPPPVFSDCVWVPVRAAGVLHASPPSQAVDDGAIGTQRVSRPEGCHRAALPRQLLALAKSGFTAYGAAINAPTSLRCNSLLINSVVLESRMSPVNTIKNIIKQKILPYSSIMGVCIVAS